MKNSDVEDALLSLWVLVREHAPVVIGSQSLHGRFPDVADTIMRSREIDVILPNKAKIGNWLSEVVGDGTPFEVERGYFIDHIVPDIARGIPVLANGWDQRSTKRPVIYDGKEVGEVRFISPEDMAISKLYAGREKDFNFLKLLVQAGYLNMKEVEALIPYVDEMYRSKLQSNFQCFVADLCEQSSSAHRPTVSRQGGCHQSVGSKCCP